MELKTVTIEKPDDMNFILGQSHFIKTVEDLHEAIVQTVPGMKFGIGFCESSGPALVRHSGNDQRLIELAQKNAMALACGHCFIIFMDGGFPVTSSIPLRLSLRYAGFFAPRPIPSRWLSPRPNRAEASSASSTA